MPLQNKYAMGKPAAWATGMPTSVRLLLSVLLLAAADVLGCSRLSYTSLFKTDPMLSRRLVSCSSMRALVSAATGFSGSTKRGGAQLLECMRAGCKLNAVPVLKGRFVTAALLLG